MSLRNKANTILNEIYEIKYYSTQKLYGHINCAIDELKSARSSNLEWQQVAGITNAAYAMKEGLKDAGEDSSREKILQITRELFGIFGSTESIKIRQDASSIATVLRQ